MCVICKIHTICSTVVAHSEEMTHGLPRRASSCMDAQVSACLLLVVAVLVFCVLISLPMSRGGNSGPMPRPIREHVGNLQLERC